MGVYYNYQTHHWELECEVCHIVSRFDRKKGPRPHYCIQCNKKRRKQFTHDWNVKLYQTRSLEKQINYPSTIEWHKIHMKGKTFEEILKI
jgi:hypothetical protein